MNIRCQENNKSAVAKHCMGNNHTFNFDSAKIVFRPISTLELDFFEGFHFHKNHYIVDNCDFAIPSLSDFWKFYIRSKLSRFFIPRLFKYFFIMFSYWKIYLIFYNSIGLPSFYFDPLTHSDFYVFLFTDDGMLNFAQTAACNSS